MPKLWVDTIEAHRREVQAAILSTAAALIAEHGVPAVTMSQIADETGIARATLYKYFSDVEAILDAWHEQHVARHLERLTAIREEHSKPRERLEAVLEAYALITHERSRALGSTDEHEHHLRRDVRSVSHHRHPQHAHRQPAADISAVVHRSDHVAAAQRRLTDFLRDLLIDAVRSGDVRDDVPPAELATFCLHALAGAASLTRPAVTRLLTVTLSALRPRRAKA